MSKQRRRRNNERGWRWISILIRVALALPPERPLNAGESSVVLVSSRAALRERSDEERVVGGGRGGGGAAGCGSIEKDRNARPTSRSVRTVWLFS